MDMEEEESEVRKLTKEELEMYYQYKEFYTIQGRTKGKMVIYIHSKSKNTILEYHLM